MCEGNIRRDAVNEQINLTRQRHGDHSPFMSGTG